MESLVSDMPAGNGNVANLILQCIIFKYKDSLDFKQISSHYDIIFNKEITIYS